jgi:Arc/MetJ family transcription regulator
MRTNIDIDEDLMSRAMQAGPYKTKKDAVEAGLKLLARQAAYREILKWEGKLRWEGDEAVDWTRPPEPERASALAMAEPASPRWVERVDARTRAKPGSPPARRATARHKAAAAPPAGSKGRARAGR